MECDNQDKAGGETVAKNCNSRIVHQIPPKRHYPTASAGRGQGQIPCAADVQSVWRRHKAPPRPKNKTAPWGGFSSKSIFADYIFSLFFILEDLDIFFLLILPFGMLSLDMLSPL
jgi:hypothetical protein